MMLVKCFERIFTIRRVVFKSARLASTPIYTGYTSQQNLLEWQQRRKQTGLITNPPLSSGSIVADMLIQNKVVQVEEHEGRSGKAENGSEETVSRIYQSQYKFNQIMEEYEETVRERNGPGVKQSVEINLLCPGCGADLHTIEPSRAGYLNHVRLSEFLAEMQSKKEAEVTKKLLQNKRNSAETLLRSKSEAQRSEDMQYSESRDEKVLEDAPHCDRCTILQKYRLALNVTVPESAYATIVKHIRSSQQPACVLVAVDVTDLPFCVPNNLPEAFGSEQHRFVVVVTKCDRIGLPSSVVDPTQFGNAEQHGIVRVNQNQNLPRKKNRQDNQDGSMTEGNARTAHRSPETRRSVLARWAEEVLRCLETRARIQRHRIDAVAFVSARTGFGIDALVSFAMDSASRRNLYLVGSANAGKSSLFNALATSDLCNANVRAAQLVRRATVSTFPGTTIGLLRFPVTVLTPKRAEIREEQLKSARSTSIQQWIKSHDRTAPASSSKTSEDLASDKRKPKDYRLSAPVIQSLAASVVVDTDEYQLFDEMATYYVDNNKSDANEAPCILQTEKSADTVEEEHSRLRFTVRPEQFVGSRWCLDTPGIIQDDHIARTLNQKELERLLGGDTWLPRTYRMRTGLTMYLSGLVRIDFLEPADPIYLTTFSPLKALICRTELAESFYYDHLDTLMQLPKRARAKNERRPDLFIDPSNRAGQEPTLNNVAVKAQPVSNNFTEERQKMQFGALPSLVANQVTLRGVGYSESCADIALSHVGWCAVTAKRDQSVHLRVYTLGGRGFAVRSPLLPFAVKERGPKIRGTLEYKVQ